MSKAPKVVTRTGIARLALGCAAVLATLALTAGSSMATTVALTTAPNLPNLTGVTLNGQTQSTLTIWSNAMKITSSGTLRACVDPEFPPEVYTAKNGQPAGFDTSSSRRYSRKNRQKRAHVRRAASTSR